MKYITRFDKIIVELFELAGYKSIVQSQSKTDTGIDLIVFNSTVKYYIETKYYRSRLVSASAIKNSTIRLSYYIAKNPDGDGLLIVNTIVPKKLKEDIYNEFQIKIWDRQNIYDQLTQLSIELRDQFEQLLLESQQGIDIKDVFSELHEPSNRDEESIVSVTKETHAGPKPQKKPINKGELLCQELKAIPCGIGWADYERKCVEILKYLFEEDLALWELQNRTDDGLSRFDLICRIASKDDYWRALIMAFNTRFVLFEFKNYCAPIGQGQIYTTERYLFNKALRSVAIIISKNGASPNAITAAKGALKEHGKLILLLSDIDLCKMLDLKDHGNSPNDYLSNILDKWLISLSV